MKKIISIAMITLIVVANAAISMGAKNIPVKQAKAKVVNIEQANDYSYMNDYMENRRTEYEAFIDQEVESGKLTKEELDQYKSDFFAMSEYCNRVRSNGKGSGYGGSCCR